MQRRPNRTGGIIAACLALLSYAYFWQSRDWNSASRLMLTYALVDRGTLSIDGLEHQCADVAVDPATGEVVVRGGDIAYHNGHFYSDKAPGLSLLGSLCYALLPARDGLKPHPLLDEAIPYWEADYWVTLATNGVLTSATVYVVYRFMQLLGAAPWLAFFTAIGYGLATPAFLYGTLFYGHNLAAFCLLTALYALYRGGSPGTDALLAGMLSGYAVVAEYPAAGVVVLWFLVAMVKLRRWPARFAFLYGAVLGAGVLLVYNWKAFGHPFRVSYAFEASQMFREVHNPDTPLGIRWWEMPAWERLPQLTYWPRRGLLWYAPWLALVPVGVLVLLWRRFSLALVIVLAVAWYVWIVLVYPNWDGGWCTGPRLLTATYPFLALLAGSAFLYARRQGWRWLLAGLVVLGMAINLGCVAVGGRFPPHVEHPLEEVVLPRWKGENRDGLRMLAGGEQFERNAGRWIARRLRAHWEHDGGGEEEAERPVWTEFWEGVTEKAWSRWRAVEFVPLALLWTLGLGLAAFLRRRES